jgi:hypothetical protein
MTETAFAYRPAVDYIVERTGGEIVRDSLRVYRDHFGPLVMIYSVPLVPVATLAVYAVAVGSSAATGAASVLQSVVSLFPAGAVTVAVSDICLGNRPSLGGAYRIMLANLWRYVGAYVLLMLAFFGGLILFVIPGLIFVTWFMFSCQVCVIERRGPVESLRRSRRLVRGSFWRCIGLWLALLLILMLAVMAAMTLLVLFNTYALSGWYSPDQWTALDELLSWVLTFCAVPFLLTGLVLLYYDLRVRKENFDSASLMDELMH